MTTYPMLIKAKNVPNGTVSVTIVFDDKDAIAFHVESRDYYIIKGV